MDLKWWPVIIAGVVCLLAAVAAAALLPMAKVERVLRPLAHVDRLTRLPEYARVYRIYFLSMIITGVLLLATFAAALTASARPIGASTTTKEFDTEHPEDIMLCVGEPVTDPTTANFLTYYAQQAKSFDTQRIGLTSSSLRVVPLTRDHEYAAQRFEYFAKMARIQQDLDTNRDVSDADRAELQTGIEKFAQSITYVDYARSVEDILALCLTGFPSFEGKSQHRRSLVYIGYSAFRSPDEQRAQLYTEQAIKDMATKAGVQINVISRSDVAESSPEANNRLQSISEATGGKFSLYNPAGTAQTEAGEDATLTRLLDEIRDNPPEVVLSSGRVVTSESWDAPRDALLAAVVAAVLLCVSLAVLRR
ncbi:hypothetical protein AFM11_24725 [Mycolicibacterium wolinskyi]|uniref:VWFA domain-containing protein n=1 Tax=Mycolicibacterium wolinskyi TaxID=59750 RepID=A0A132PGE9_9MYCO|nr:hypothetical protein [Mycolicibacterium wolinskyi]KWX21428.1 hypothetical protein AFM11_24725 [Mycolicibacterium wolinskyi]